MKIISARTAASAARTAIYGSIAGTFAISEAETIAMVDAIVIGGMMADYITWLFRSVITLPGNLLHGCYDGVINILFGWYIYRLVKFEIQPDESSIAFAFITFLLISGLKIGYYSIKSVVQISEEV